jgi:putative flippase GtrA
MKDKLKKCFDLGMTLFKKYEEIIVYLIVGVMTTIVSWFCMFFVNIVIFGNPLHPTSTQNLILSIVNWTAGVLFAYPTNRKFVFKSKDKNILGEFAKFVASRISTLILDIVVRQVLGLLGVDAFVTTLISAVLVIIGNYVFSKLLVFRKK